MISIWKLKSFLWIWSAFHWLASLSQACYSKIKTLQEKILYNIKWYLIIKYVMFFMTQCSVPQGTAVLQLVIHSFNACLLSSFYAKQSAKFWVVKWVRMFFALELLAIRSRHKEISVLCNCYSRYVNKVLWGHWLGVERGAFQ